MTSETSSVARANGKNDLSLTRDVKRLSQIFAIVVGLALAIVIFLVARILSRDELSPNLFATSMLVGAATGVIGSAVFYLLYSRFAQERVIEDVADRVSRASIEFAKSLYEQEYLYFLPSELYPETDAPLRSFNESLERLLGDSKTYWVKGVAGTWPSFRFHRLGHSGLGSTKKDIRIQLMDPSKPQLLVDRARYDIAQTGEYAKKDLDAQIDRIQKAIYVTIVALFDNAHRMPVQLFFYRERPFFRFEILDEGIFLSYFIGRMQLPPTYYYSLNTQPYKAYLHNFLDNCSGDPIIFSDASNNNELENVLDGLGCKVKVNGLRREVSKRFIRLSEVYPIE